MPGLDLLGWGTGMVILIAAPLLIQEKLNGGPINEKVTVLVGLECTAWKSRAVDFRVSFKKNAAQSRAARANHVNHFEVLTFYTPLNYCYIRWRLGLATEKIRARGCSIL